MGAERPHLIAKIIVFSKTLIIFAAEVGQNRDLWKGGLLKDKGSDSTSPPDLLIKLFVGRGFGKIPKVS